MVTALGADHADRWRATPGAAAGYALAFGHFANKNADKVLDAWAQFCRDEPSLTLRLVGMSAPDRAAAAQRVAELGIADRVELMPWLSDEQFSVVVPWLSAGSQ